MKYLLSLTGLMLMLGANISATIIVESHWRMGEEAGDFAGSVDSVGGRDFNTSAGPLAFAGDPAPSSNGSTTAANTRNLTGRAGFFGPATSSFMPADNWGVEMWARSANTTQAISLMEVQGGGPVNGNLKISQLAGDWAASYHGVAWIGANNGAGQTVTAETWTHLAVVRDAGTTSLYIDGQPQVGTIADAPVWGNSLHLGVLPGGAAGWEGDFDEVRAFTFTPGAFNPNTDLLFSNIPEPQTFMLVLLGGLPLIRLMRKRQATASSTTSKARPVRLL
jgi:hypothetical protein